jgi:threonine/homoserine/homoserine lactone efflux protein
MGFVAAIPIGATQLEIARRSLNGFLSSALMLVVGSVISDVMYGVLALFGITPLLQHPTVIAVFWLINAIILVVLAIWTIRQSKSPSAHSGESGSNLGRLNIAFLTGFSLAITNPLMIVWWLFGARLLMDVGLIAKYTVSNTFLFLAIGGLGIGSYLSLLAFIVLHVKSFVSEKTIQRITLVFGVVLLGLAAYITARSAIVLMR